MIYNFVELLKNQFPSELIYTNGRILIAGQTVIPDRNILVNETGGLERPWNRYRQATVQILTRDKDSVTSREIAYDIFNFLTSRFGLILPVITVNGTIFAELKTAQISAIQLPFNLGPDEESRIEYSTNYMIIL